jgi:hypothetical protein
MESKSNFYQTPVSIPKLKFNPFTKESNFQDFKEQLNMHCFRMKEIGSAILTLTLPTIPGPAQPLASTATKSEEFTWCKDEERRRSRTYAQEDSLRELYSIIMCHLDRNMLNAVQLHADFAAATTAQNGLDLWKIVSKIASGSSSTESALMQERRLVDSFANCVQGDTEPIADYYFRFSNTIKDIVLAALTAPSDAMQAHRFIENLSDRQYFEYKTSSRNFSNLGIAYPATLSAAVAKVSEYRPTMAASLPSRHVAAVANIATEKKRCTYCGRERHTVEECRTKLRDESKPPANQAPPPPSRPRNPSRGRGGRRGRGRGRSTDRAQPSSNHFVSAWKKTTSRRRFVTSKSRHPSSTRMPPREPSTSTQEPNDQFSALRTTSPTSDPRAESLGSRGSTQAALLSNALWREIF